MTCPAQSQIVSRFLWLAQLQVNAGAPDADFAVGSGVCVLSQFRREVNQRSLQVTERFERGSSPREQVSAVPRGNFRGSQECDPLSIWKPRRDLIEIWLIVVPEAPISTVIAAGAF